MASFTVFITLILGALVALSSAHPAVPVLQGFDAGALPEDGSPTGFPDTTDSGSNRGGDEMEEGTDRQVSFSTARVSSGRVGRNEREYAVESSVDAGVKDGDGEKDDDEDGIVEESGDEGDDDNGDDKDVRYGMRAQQMRMEMTEVEKEEANALSEASEMDVKASPEPSPKRCFLGIFC